MAHVLIGAALGLAAFVAVLAQGGGVALALGAYAGIGAASTLCLAILPELAAGLAAGLARLAAPEEGPVPVPVLARR